jgi:hypothetical protein
VAETGVKIPVLLGQRFMERHHEIDLARRHMRQLHAQVRHEGLARKACLHTPGKARIARGEGLPRHFTSAPSRNSL